MCPLWLPVMMTLIIVRGLRCSNPRPHNTLDLLLFPSAQEIVKRVQLSEAAVFVSGNAILTLFLAHKLWAWVDSGTIFTLLSLDAVHRLGMNWERDWRQMRVVGEGSFMRVRPDFPRFSAYARRVAGHARCAGGRWRRNRPSDRAHDRLAVRRGSSLAASMTIGMVLGACLAAFVAGMPPTIRYNRDANNSKTE